MNTSAIEKQIRNCRNLLKLFQEEREGYLQRNSISMKDVIDILRKKMELISDLEELKRFVHASAKEDECQEDSQGEKRKQIRILSDLLEQLLVIEHENELLLKDMMDNVSAPSRNVPKTKLSSTRRPISAKFTGIPIPPTQPDFSMRSTTLTANEKNPGKPNVARAKRKLTTYA